MASSTRSSLRPHPLPVQRDRHDDLDIRNKENLPTSSQTKTASNGVRRSFIPSLVPSTEKLDFFTDSFLADGNASETSLIPSPLPKATVIARPRQKFRPIKSSEDYNLKPSHRSTRSELPAIATRKFQVSHQKPLARGTSPIRSTGLSTPPRSRDGSFTESPVEAQFSSPPRALTETYERIDQEEDLAATEGEISDPDSEPPAREGPQIMNGQPGARPVYSDPAQPRPRSRASTPTNARFTAFGQRGRDDDLTVASVLSDPTGMSFVNQLSDPNIAQALTPHMLQSAADKEALRKIWDSKRPIAFGKANKIHLDGIEPSQPVQPLSQASPPQRLIAFSKAGKRKLASDLALRPQHQRTFSDVTDRLTQAAQDDNRPVSGDVWHNDDLKRGGLPLNPRLARVPYFSKTHGFPEKQSATDLNGFSASFQKSKSESPYTRPAQSFFNHNQMVEQNMDSPNLDPLSNNNNRSGPDINLEGQSAMQSSSHVDWMQVAADSPMQSVETGLQRRSQSRLSDMTDLEVSPEKSRKLDMDFTGQSFQVSESPPVRARSLAQDMSREREIRGLERRAVTTSRLSQLRAQESLERLRQSSRSPVSETSDAQRETNRSDVELRALSEHLPDTPAIAKKTTPARNGSRRSSSPSLRPTPDRLESHDLLQRLSRGSSSTPRSSTPSERPTGFVVQNHDDEVQANAAEGSDSQDETDQTVQGPLTSNADSVKATPKVTGGWTDTILPDTVKTFKQTVQRVKYAQTPHINAGGWIDTPAPMRLEPVSESTQEIPEELMNGIVRDGTDSKDMPKIGPITEMRDEIPPQIAQSLAKKVLAEAKEKLTIGGSPRPITSADDSLVLGNATIQSLENVLDMDETDMTILSKLGEEPLDQTDTQVLDRLVSKLDRLRTHIHDARTGISKLESQISQPAQPAAPAAQMLLCEICGQQQSADQPHTHPSKSTSYLPLTLLTLTFPVPILFRRSPPGSNRRFPQPTPLGWLVLAIWAWYLLECTLAEIYSHPQYASHYIWPDHKEPEFPFVLPTMLWRWSHLDWVHPYLLRPAAKFFTGIFRMIGIWCGLVEGFADGPADTIVENVVETVYQQAGTGILDAGLGMMNDEFV